MQVCADEIHRRAQALEKQWVAEAQRLGQEATKAQHTLMSVAETALQNLEKDSAKRLVDQADRLALVRTPT
jgi:hypothetical protein